MFRAQWTINAEDLGPLVGQEDCETVSSARRALLRALDGLLPPDADARLLEAHMEALHKLARALHADVRPELYRCGRWEMRTTGMALSITEL